MSTHTYTDLIIFFPDLPMSSLTIIVKKDLSLGDTFPRPSFLWNWSTILQKDPYASVRKQELNFNKKFDHVLVISIRFRVFSHFLFLSLISIKRVRSPLRQLYNRKIESLWKD